MLFCDYVWIYGVGVIKLFDTAISDTVPMVSSPDETIGMYVCGATVYGPPHVGHGRFALVYDILWRYLEYSGYKVIFASNVTDIDDKIIDRANREGRSWRSLAAESEEQWWRNMELLNVRKPHHTPHATDYIDQMIESIVKLEEKGYAYRLDDGVYMEVGRLSSYGLLAHQNLDTLRSGARVSVDQSKHSPLDFALWKAAKPGEPTWGSPFGAGRPGWHTECVVMASSLLGDDFVLHGGGLDLCFPHHENERAQAQALSINFARHWIHNGLVEVGGQKMSKSLGNYITLEEMFHEHNPSAYRLLVLQSSYRSPIEVTADLMNDAEKALERINALSRRLDDIQNSTSYDDLQLSEAMSGIDIDEKRHNFVNMMDDDFNTSSATALLFTSLRQANTLLDHHDVVSGYRLGKFVVEAFIMLGIGNLASTEAIDPKALAIVEARDAARLSRDFAKADELKSQIELLGYRVEDSTDGTKLRKIN